MAASNSKAVDTEVEELRRDVEKYRRKALEMEQALNQHVRVVAAIENKVADLRSAFRELCEDEDILRVGLVAAEDEREGLEWEETLDAFPELTEDRILELREKYKEITKRFFDMTGVWSA